MLIMFGSKIGKVEIGVNSLPNRKKKCLVYSRGITFEPLAYFRDDECAEKFEKLLDLIVEMYEKR